MPHYRVHILDRRGKLLGAVDLECRDDDEAKERIAEVLRGEGGELWRRVEVLEPNDPTSRSIQKGRTKSH
jgi:hypothetical protein